MLLSWEGRVRFETVEQSARTSRRRRERGRQRGRCHRNNRCGNWSGRGRSQVDHETVDNGRGGRRRTLVADGDEKRVRHIANGVFFGFNRSPHSVELDATPLQLVVEPHELFLGAAGGLERLAIGLAIDLGRTELRLAQDFFRTGARLGQGLLSRAVRRLQHELERLVDVVHRHGRFDWLRRRGKLVEERDPYQLVAEAIDLVIEIADVTSNVGEVRVDFGRVIAPARFGGKRLADDVSGGDATIDVFGWIPSIT